MKRFRTFYVLFMIAFIVLSGCSRDNYEDEELSANPNMGINNYTDVAVTGGLQEVGITYADLLGYVNYPDGEEYDLPVGVMYGEKKDELKELAYGQNIGRKIKVTIRGLKPNTKYYYKTFVGPVEYHFVGKNTASFTTQEAAFNGEMTTKVSDVTFKQVKIVYNIDVSSLSEKENYETALVFSTKPISLTPHEMFEKFMNKDASGHIDNLSFMQNKNQIVNITCSPGSTFYYCVFLTIGGEIFMNEVQRGSLREFSVTSKFVDLGLSCDWASANFDCSSPFDLGSTLRLDKVGAMIEKRYGKGYSMPTVEQVEELNRCRLEVVDDGVLVTGLNGNQMYIPMPNVYSGCKDYGTRSTTSYVSGTGAYRHSEYYSMLFRASSDGKFYTYRSATPFYDSYLPNYSSYHSCYIRVVRNK